MDFDKDRGNIVRTNVNVIFQHDIEKAINEKYLKIKLLKDGLSEDFLACDGDCGDNFDPNSNDYFIIAGDLYIGKHGGLVGCNFTDKGRLGRVNIFCWECLMKIIIGALRA
jgi:hypothetical protein